MKLVRVVCDGPRPFVAGIIAVSRCRDSPADGENAAQ